MSSCGWRGVVSGCGWRGVVSGCRWRGVVSGCRGCSAPSMAVGGGGARVATRQPVEVQGREGDDSERWVGFTLGPLDAAVWASVKALVGPRARSDPQRVTVLVQRHTGINVDFSAQALTIPIELKAQVHARLAKPQDVDAQSRHGNGLRRGERITP